MSEEAKASPENENPSIAIIPPAKEENKEPAETAKAQPAPNNAGMKMRMPSQNHSLKVSISKPGALMKWNEIRVKGSSPAGRSHCIAYSYKDK